MPMKLTPEQVQEIADSLLNYAQERGYDKYAYGFGFLIAEIRSEDLAKIPAKLERLEELFPKA